MIPPFASPEAVMRHALSLAMQGRGLVEPNPAVGAVIVDDYLRPVAEGFHEQFGGPHAEVVALRTAGDSARDATLFVTLEPCCHHGKTGPCAQAVIAAGIKHVVVGTTDPNPQVVGQGIAALREAGLTVVVGLLQPECNRLIAPFAKWITTGLPWVHAKWAMSLDGKIATHTGHSQWISNPASRAVVHELRGRMDAVIVGAETAARDNPSLTARPPGPRIATRVVVSRSARLSPTSLLAQSAKNHSVIVTTTVTEPNDSDRQALKTRGVEILALPMSATSDETTALSHLLRELGRRNMTNVLVEGGGRLLGSLRDAGLIDEVHVFVASKLIGGEFAPSPMAGQGRECISELSDLMEISVDVLERDVYIHGLIPHSPAL